MHQVASVVSNKHRDLRLIIKELTDRIRYIGRVIGGSSVVQRP